MRTYILLMLSLFTSQLYSMGSWHVWSSQFENSKGSHNNVINEESSSLIFEWAKDPMRKPLNLLNEALSSGIDPNEQGKLYTTPLRIAVEFRNLKAVQLLLEYGADANKHSPLHVAVQEQNKELLLLLLKHGADPNASSHGNCFYRMEAPNSIINILLRYGANPYFTDEYGRNLFSYMDISKFDLQQKFEQLITARIKLFYKGTVAGIALPYDIAELLVLHCYPHARHLDLAKMRKEINNAKNE